jgi:hypothetical protein
MPDPNLIYDPPEQWENTTIFKDNPTDIEVRPMFTRIFTQIQTFINTTLIAWINNTFTTKTDITTNRKLDSTGNFTGTLNGAAITSSDAGLAATVTGHLTDSTYQLATGTGTAITLAISTLTDGYAKTFVVSANNSGSATTINGKPLYKPNTTIAPNLTAGKAVTVWYNLVGNCFFIKASAEGDAVAGDVLASKKFSNDTDVGLSGSMIDRGTVNITPSTTNQAITDGKHSGSGVVYGDTDLIASNILSGVNIFNVVGTATISSLGGKKYFNGSGTTTSGSVLVGATVTFNIRYAIIKIVDREFYFSLSKSSTNIYNTDDGVYWPILNYTTAITFNLPVANGTYATKTYTYEYFE